MGAGPHLASGPQPLTPCGRPLWVVRRGAPRREPSQPGPPMVAHPPARLVGLRQRGAGAGRRQRREWASRAPPAAVVGVGTIGRRPATAKQHPRQDEHRREREQGHEHHGAAGEAQHWKQKDSDQHGNAYRGGRRASSHGSSLPALGCNQPGPVYRPPAATSRHGPVRRSASRRFFSPAGRETRGARGVRRGDAGEVADEDAVANLSHQVADGAR